jgi:hypothetical protein
MRRASLQDTLPAVSGSNGLAKDIDVFFSIDVVVRWNRPVLDLRPQHSPSRTAITEFEDVAVTLTGIHECLTVAEVDLEQPLVPSDFTRTGTKWSKRSCAPK